VFARVLVCIAVDLYDDARCRTAEVNDETLDRVLTAESEP